MIIDPILGGMSGMSLPDHGSDTNDGMPYTESNSSSVSTHLESSNYDHGTMIGVTLMATIVLAILCAYGIVLLRRIQRIILKKLFFKNHRLYSDYNNTDDPTYKTILKEIIEIDFYSNYYSLKSRR